MLKSYLAVLILFFAASVCAEERVWPDVELSCQSSSAIEAESADERQFIFYIYPSSNALIVTEIMTVDSRIRRLETQNLRVTPTSYTFLESGNQFDIDRTTLEFSMMFSYAAASNYSGAGNCFVINPQI